MINPGESINGGSFLTLETRVPEDCILNAKLPSACEWYFSPLGLLADLMIDCLGQAMPEQAVAASFSDSMIISFSGFNQKQRQWVVFEPIADGWGGFRDGDGESALINLSNGSFRNIPAEVYESRFPLRINEFSIRKDSGGSGRPPAIDTRQPDGVTCSALKMKPTRLPAGTVVKTETGGGGGYGDAFKRCEKLITRDILDGYISKNAAKQFYGVVFSEDGKIDSKATVRRRFSKSELVS